MKNTNRKKLLGFGILVCLVVAFFNFDTKKKTALQRATRDIPVLPSQTPDPVNPFVTSVPIIAIPSSNIRVLPASLPASLPATLPANLPVIVTDLATDLPKNKKPTPSINDGCFNLTFTHKKLTSHEDGEACLLHKNLIVLNSVEQAPKSKISPKSICMRINGKAAKYSFAPGKTNQVILAPEAGPNATITASYCVGKAKCTRSCVPQKDQFLAAIGADEDGDSVQAVGWDGQKIKNKEDDEVENQMTGLNQDLNSAGGDNSQLFAGWILEAQNTKCE